MPWHAQLELDYTFKHDSTVLHHRHNGPLRIFQSLYPEGKTICHNVVVHPPGGLANGDVVDIRVNVGPDAHAWIGTPGATRRRTGSTCRSSAAHVSAQVSPRWTLVQ